MLGQKLLLAAALVVGTNGVAMADDVEERVAILEQKVARLESVAPVSCITKADGFIFASRTQTVYLEKGTWAYTGNTYKANFEFQITKSFTTEKGTKLIAVKMSAPGFTPNCESLVFLESDVFLN